MAGACGSTMFPGNNRGLEPAADTESATGGYLARTAENEQLRAEVSRVTAELDRVKAESQAEIMRLKAEVAWQRLGGGEICETLRAENASLRGEVLRLEAEVEAQKSMTAGCGATGATPLHAGGAGLEEQREKNRSFRMEVSMVKGEVTDQATTRAECERLAAENSRITAEAMRLTAEATRVAAEAEGLQTPQCFGPLLINGQIGSVSQRFWLGMTESEKMVLDAALKGIVDKIANHSGSTSDMVQEELERVGLRFAKRTCFQEGNGGDLARSKDSSQTPRRRMSLIVSSARASTARFWYWREIVLIVERLMELRGFPL